MISTGIVTDIITKEQKIGIATRTIMIRLVLKIMIVSHFFLIFTKLLCFNSVSYFIIIDIFTVVSFIIIKLIVNIYVIVVDLKLT